MINWFERIVGKGNVSEEEIDKLVYSTDASQIKGETRLVVWPKNAEEIHKIVLFAKRNKTNLVIRGAGTGLVGGCIPRDEVVMDLSKLNKILNISEYERSVIVQAGVVLNNLNLRLKKLKLFFPVIPSSHKVCTIGGMISTNAVGIRAIKYGRVENWVKALEIMDGTGRLRRIKGNEIKNFCGKEGTTGIILRAKLKLDDLPEKRSLDIFKFEDEELEELVEKVRELQDEEVSAIEFINTKAAKIAGLEELNHLIIEYEDFRGEFKEENEIEKIWKMREGILTKINAKEYSISEDPKLPLDKIIDFLYWLKNNNIPAFGHIGVGIIHPHFKRDSEKIEEMFEIVKKLNGEVSGEHGIGLLKKKYVDPEILKEIKELKDKYNPDNIINGGKIC